MLGIVPGRLAGRYLFSHEIRATGGSKSPVMAATLEGRGVNPHKSKVPTHNTVAIASENRPEIGTGVGGLLYNAIQAYMQIEIGNTNVGFAKITRCTEIFVKYPGLCRFSTW